MAANVILNLYKEPGIFTCHHPAHKQFAYEVSPYHIFKVKKCYPQGCVEFLWRCHQLEKGHPCPRKYKHVGNGCASCKHYHENKLAYSPESSLDKSELNDLVDEIRQFQGWLEEMRGKTVSFSGKIDNIAPHLEMKRDENGDHVTMDGFYLSFDRAHLGNDLFDDRIYIRISGNQIEKHDFAPGDLLECRAEFTESRGRIILQRLSHIDLTKNGGSRKIDLSMALVGRAVGKVILGQANQCKGCPYLSLIDIEDNRRRKPVYYRRYYCLRGLTDPETCPVRLRELLERDRMESRQLEDSDTATS